jgi:hypothetical protein
MMIGALRGRVGSASIIAACLRRFPFSPWVLLLASQYWFRVPILGTAIATACLGAAWLLYLL